MKQCDEVYDYEKGKLRLDILDNFFSICRRKYSDRLCSIVQFMINIDENTRPDFVQLATELGLNYHQGILYGKTSIPQNLL